MQTRAGSRQQARPGRSRRTASWRACHSEPPDAAGGPLSAFYLPEYRAVREKAGDFLKLCFTPELAAEATQFNLIPSIRIRCVNPIF
jgi:hypothetical protein